MAASAWFLVIFGVIFILSISSPGVKAAEFGDNPRAIDYDCGLPGCIGNNLGVGFCRTVMVDAPCLIFMLPCIAELMSG